MRQIIRDVVLPMFVGVLLGYVLSNFEGDKMILFLSNIISTFLGALFAFIFSFFLYRYQKKSNDTAYLKYSVAQFLHMVSELYCLKEQHIQYRISKINELTGTLGEVFPLDENVGPHLLKKLHTTTFKISIDFEKLHFLVSHDPNVLMLLKGACNTYENISSIIDDCNLCVDRFFEEPENMYHSNMVISCNKSLAITVDDAIYLTELASETLIKACRLYYDDEKVKGFELEEKYKPLKPDPIESYEKLEWFS